MTSVVVVRDRRSKPFFYAIDHYLSYWRSIGYQVIDHVGPEHVPDGDVLVFHVDTTILPRAYKLLCERFPIVINGQVEDISRRRFSQLLLSQSDNYVGPVIVKTDANFGGWPEHVLSKQWGWKQRFMQWSTVQSLPLCIGSVKTTWSWPSMRSPRDLMMRTAAKIMTWTSGLMFPPNLEHWRTLKSLDPLRYPIFESIQSVPSSVWENKNLVVERFLPEYHEGLFYTNYFVFFGDKEFSGRLGANQPIVKFGNCVVEEVIPVPAVIRECRESLQVDFGRIDYVCHNGEYYVIDVNKTEGGGGNNEKYCAEFEVLASGLESLLAAKRKAKLVR